MENIEAPMPYNTPNFQLKLIESKKYELKYKEDIYSLLIERYSDDNIFFKLRKSNNLSIYNYMNKYNYNDITRLFLLQKEYYENLSKVFQFFDLALINKKIKLEYNNDKNIMELILNKKLDFDEVECKLVLNKNKIENDEMFIMLINEINEMKNNKSEKQDNNNIINELINKNKEYENKFKILEDKIKKLEEQIEKYKESSNNLTNEVLLSSKEEKPKLISQNDFKENPQNLKFKYQLTKNRADSGCLDNFDLFIGLKDRKEYIIYNNKDNYNLDIMRINDQFIIISLKGHNGGTNVIRYYLKNNNEDYILSCDKNKLVIIWDIQNNYNKKYLMQPDYSGLIWDALLLFNIYNKDYILLSNGSENEYSKLYEFKNNTSFVKNIYGTNKNKTSYMIPWLYNNKYYIIECCFDKKISINSIFENHNYANLSKEPEGNHCCGYIYNNNYLFVSDRDNNFVRIWDLVNKSIYKQINYTGSFVNEIIPWNNIYMILSSKDSFIIINVIEGKMIKKIMFNEKNDLYGVKKMKINGFGECLIGSGDGNVIKLFCI